MQEQILFPAGMPHSTFKPADVPADALAWPHLRSPEMRVNPVYPYQRADAPSSFLHTTLVDLCQWAVTSLNRGSYRGRSLLSPAAYELMWTPVAERGKQRPSLYEHIGLGWTLGHFKEVKTVSHGGGGFGGTSFLLILPEKNCAVAVLCNQESYAHFQVVRAAADALTGQKPQVGKVSCMVPVSRAMAQGGLAAAYARWAEIRAKEDEFTFDESDLIDLSLQAFTAGKVDLALEVLDFNLHVFPQSAETHVQQAKLYLHTGQLAPAKENLLQALAIEPDHTAAASLLAHLLERETGKSGPAFL